MELLRLFLETKQKGNPKSMLNYFFLNTGIQWELVIIAQVYMTALRKAQAPFIL